MNGITEAHIVRYKNVRFGYSFLSSMKQQKSTFNSYNLFPAVFIQTWQMCCLLYIFCVFNHPDQRARICLKNGQKHIVSGVADQVAAVILTVSVDKLQTKVFI